MHWTYYVFFWTNPTIYQFNLCTHVDSQSFSLPSCEDDIVAATTSNLLSKSTILLPRSLPFSCHHATLVTFKNCSGEYKALVRLWWYGTHCVILREILGRQWHWSHCGTASQHEFWFVKLYLETVETLCTTNAIMIFCVNTAPFRVWVDVNVYEG